MLGLSEAQVAKKATNVSISSRLLQQARELNINLSATLEQALQEIIRQKQRERWLVENQNAIDTYNLQVGEQGVFSDGLRTF